MAAPTACNDFDDGLICCDFIGVDKKDSCYLFFY